MQRPAANLVAGFVASGVGTLTALAVVPVYLRHLGSERYGIVALFLALQALLQVFDLGLTATANRRVAQTRAGPASGAVDPVLQALGWLTWAAAAALTLFLLGAAPLLATGWLRLEQVPRDEATSALLLMALALGARWPAGLYQNVLLGADRQGRWSFISSVVTVVAHGGAAVLLLLTEGGLVAFFTWHLLAALALVTWTHFAARRDVPALRFAWPDLRKLRAVGEFSLGMTGISLTALGLMHLDKLLLSRLLPLDLFGHYMLALLVAGSFYSLVMPIFNWCYPRFTLLAAREPAVLPADYSLVSHAVASLLLPLAMLFAVSSESLLALWLGDLAVARRVAPLLAMLAAGAALHGLMFIPYALTLARGAAGLALRINIALLLVFVPMLTGFTWWLGAAGAALAWLVLHVGYATIGSFHTHAKLLPSMRLRWLANDVGPPLLIAAIVGVPGYLVGRGALAGASPLWQATWGVALCVTCWVLLVLTSHRLRRLASFRFERVPG